MYLDERLPDETKASGDGWSQAAAFTLDRACPPPSPHPPGPVPPRTPPTHDLGGPAVSSQDVAQTTSASARGAPAMCWGHEAQEAPELARGQLPGARPLPAALSLSAPGDPCSPFVWLPVCWLVPAPHSLLSGVPSNPLHSSISSASGWGLLSRGGACPRSWNRRDPGTGLSTPPPCFRRSRPRWSILLLKKLPLRLGTPRNPAPLGTSLRPGASARRHLTSSIFSADGFLEWSLWLKLPLLALSSEPRGLPDNRVPPSAPKGFFD